MWTPGYFILNQVWHGLQERLGMSARQRAAARAVLDVRNVEMARIHAERGHLLHRLELLQSRAHQRQQHSEALISLLDVVAALEENAAEQQEVWIHSNRQYIFQVCSPLNIQKLLLDQYPGIPDFPGALELVANST